MNRFICLLILLLITCCQAFSQAVPTVPADTGRKVVEWIFSEKFRYERIDSLRDLTFWVGKAKFRQDRTIFECDSAVYNRQGKILEAFGNVHINDADSIHTYSQYLLYHTDTKIAILRRKVKLTDGKITLYTDSLKYDSNEKIGEYYNGGRVENGKTILTSKEGTYYGELKDVYFKKDVVMNDPQYNLVTDSLLYNTEAEMATFITKTFIQDSAKRNITTSEGFYDLKNKKASFGRRPIIVDTKARTRTIADDVQSDDKTGITILTGNAVYVDSAQGVSLLANYIKTERDAGTLFATQKPLMIIKQDKDSIYVRADTLFSGKLSTLKRTRDSLARLQDTTVIAGGLQRTLPAIGAVTNDSKRLPAPVGVIPRVAVNDSAAAPVTVNDSAAIRDKMAIKDSVAVRDSIGIRDTMAIQDRVVARDSIAFAQKPSVPGKPGDTLARVQAPPPVLRNKDRLALSQKPVPQKPVAQNPVLATKDTLKGITVMDTASVPKNDSADRYFQAYHNVRIFSDSLQAVCDSLFYSGEDSVFQLFTDPVAWSGVSQITGDTMFLYTKNKKPERLYVWENSLAVNKVQPGDNMYNQLKGNRMNGYFADGVIDYLRSKGNAESIYYVMDDDSALMGINKVQGDIIDLRFKNQELDKVVVISDPSGTMIPILKATEQDRQLRSFKWHEARRPKTKYELFAD